MSIKEKVTADRIQAMKDKNAPVKSITQILAARFKNEEIELKRELSDAEVISLVRKELKQTQDSLADAKKAGQDGAEYARQVEYLTSLVPAELTEEQVRDKVAAIAAGIPQGSLNKGSLMKAVMAELKGQVDGKVISQAVDACLSAV